MKSIFRIIKKKATHIKNIIVRNAKKIYHSFDKNIVFSIGENCLTDDIISRNHIKSFSSPYASGRSNIEYVLSFEQEKFADFLDFKYLQYEFFEGKQVARNKKYCRVENKYSESVTNGFEFTHHDVISNKSLRRKMNKRCMRLIHLHRKNIVLVYHHRMCTATDIGLLASHLAKLSEIYKQRNNTVHVFAFTQCLVSDSKLRKVEKQCIDGIWLYTFYVQNEWKGDNQDIFWARCDDDLINVMIDDIKKIFINKF